MMPLYLSCSCICLLFPWLYTSNAILNWIVFIVSECYRISLRTSPFSLCMNLVIRQSVDPYDHKILSHTYNMVISLLKLCLLIAKQNHEHYTILWVLKLWWLIDYILSDCHVYMAVMMAWVCLLELTYYQLPYTLWQRSLCPLMALMKCSILTVLNALNWSFWVSEYDKLFSSSYAALCRLYLMLLQLLYFSCF